MLQQWMHQRTSMGSSLAQRLLASPDGERRINHLLHLGELLQQAGTHLSGCVALVRYLGEQIQSLSPPADSAHLRLESDAQRVQIITYHKSKGLEYPWVWVPFLSSFGPPADTTTTPSIATDAEPPMGEAEVGSEEDMRLIYVALTRAREAAWVGMGPVTGELREGAAKGRWLRSAPSELLQRTHKNDLWERLQAAWGHCPDIHISQREASEIEAHHSLYQGAQPALDFSRVATPRPLSTQRWWTASFSAMTRQLDAELAIQASDEVQPDTPDVNPAPYLDLAWPHRGDREGVAVGLPPLEDASIARPSPWQSFPAGARPGVLLHDLLQWQCEHGWPLAQDPHPSTATAHAAWLVWLARKAMALDLTEVQTALITPWLQAVLRTPLPTPVPNAPHLRLGQLQPHQAWAEMPFTLGVSCASTQAIDALISAHVLPGLPRRALWPQRLNGMLTGVMDLVFEHQGRYGVLDYKSNRLDNYQATDLEAAVLDHRYDVQYVLYTLALHRLLQVRLPGYDYDLHMGGAVYLFMRGIDQANAGVHLHRPARALIEALDALLQKDAA
jgi:exodeoxyribonuclease V beta subunit